MSTVILFYKFIRINSPKSLRDDQRLLCERLNLKGRILIAEEGINATLEGEKEQIEEYQRELAKDSRFADVVFKSSESDGHAFAKLIVRVRPEIVTLGTGALDQTKTAKVISADELQSMYEQDEDFVVLDLRNNYEIAAGAFDKTVQPDIDVFRDLPKKLKLLEEYKGKKILLVSHGDVLQILHTYFSGKPANHHRLIPHLETAEIRELAI